MGTQADELKTTRNLDLHNRDEPQGQAKDQDRDSSMAWNRTSGSGPAKEPRPGYRQEQYSTYADSKLCQRIPLR